MTDGHSLVPRDKFDLQRAKAAVAAGYPTVEPVLGDLFAWLQDCNWPVADVIAPFLASLGLVTVPHVKRVLESNDAIWKYWVLTRAVVPQPEVAGAIHSELERIVREPSLGEREEGVVETAQELLAGRAAQQWVEADEAGLRMEPRRLTQCWADPKHYRMFTALPGSPACL